MKKSIYIIAAIMIMAAALNAQTLSVPADKATALIDACATCSQHDTASLMPLAPVFIQKRGSYNAKDMAGGTTTVSTEGTSFWLTFLKNQNVTPRLDLVVSSRQAGTVTVTNPNTNWSDVFTITANSVTIVTLPNAQVECTSDNYVLSKGVHVQSTVPISLYSSNYAQYTFDAANILPDQALSTDYIIQTYSGSTGNDEFVVLATEDNTTVDVQTSSQTTITLDAGEAYKFAGVNLSGSTVHATKKVAVFNGNFCTQVPYGNPACDHIYEQAIPINAWGKEFGVTKTSGCLYDRIRITALTNNTVISVNGTAVQTIHAATTYELQLDSNSSYITTSEPVACYLYIAGGAINTPTNIADPSMVWMSPLEQRVNQITFATLDTNVCHDHFVNIVTPTAALSTMKIDGQVITGFSPLLGNSTYSYKQLQVTPGVHTLENTTSGFVAHIYGIGEWESYAYNVGSNMKIINNYDINGNDRGDVYLEDTTYATICSGSYYLFRGDSIRQSGIYFDTIEVDAGSYSIHMLQLSVLPAVRSTMSAMICRGDYYTFNGRNLTDAGVYYDTASAENGCDSIIQLSLNYYPDATSSIYFDLCQGESFSYRGREIISAGSAQGDTIVMDTMMTTKGCDSIITIVINVHPVIHHSETRHVCPGTHYTFRGRDVWQAGTYRDVVSTDQGCDEIFELNLIIDPEYHNVTFDTVVTGDARFYQYFSQNRAVTGVYYDTMRSSFGCDSICELHLTVLPAPITVTICQGESYQFQGRNYSIPGTYNYVDSTGVVHQLKLIVNPTYRIQLYESLCQGNVSTITRRQYDVPGTYVDSLYLITSRGCDSVVLYNITVHPAYYEERSITICEYDSFMFGNQMVNASGVYRHTVPTTGGCDSMVVLNVRMVKTSYYDTVSVCYGDSIFWYGAWRSAAADHFYTDTVSAEDNCNCAVNRHLHINYVGETAILAAEPSYMCADEHEYSIHVDWQGDQPEYYNISYTEPSVAGPCNRYGEVFPGADIVVPFSATVEPGFYEAEVELFSGQCHHDNSVRKFTLEVRYPSTIMNQHWNDVVAVYNRNYNGGYDFAEFEWYVNGNKVYGENGSNLYLTSLMPNDEVSVKLRQREDSLMLFSCPLIIQDMSNMEESEFPIVLSGTPYQLKANENCSYQLFSMSGQLIQSGSLEAGSEMEIVLPYSAGCYLLRVSTITDTKTFKLLKQY